MKTWICGLFIFCALSLSGFASEPGLVSASNHPDWTLSWVSLPNAWATLALLVGLELVLGIDNILVITIAVSRVPKEKQDLARMIGLGLALVMRLLALAGAGLLISMSSPLFTLFGYACSMKDMVLLAGGLFLTWKAVKEIHHSVEHPEPAHGAGVGKAVATTFGASIVQIVLLDMVFSIDSVITAVGLTSHMMIIVFAVLASFLAVLIFAKSIGDFVLRHSALKILALAFLVCIGMTLILEGLHKHVPKEYLYLPMGFALLVELLQMRASAKAKNYASTNPPEHG